MGPKVRAAIAFIRAGGHTAVITNSERAARSLDPAADSSATGTRIVAAAGSLDAAS
jgi:carbamate kinase